MAKETTSLTKEKLLDKIIPALLYNKDGKEILKNVQIALNNRNESISKIKKQFEDNDIYSTLIWNNFIQFFE